MCECARLYDFESVQGEPNSSRERLQQPLDLKKDWVGLEKDRILFENKH